jgi:putative phage-type endonuclease
MNYREIEFKETEGREDWLKVRQKGIGGSDVGAIAGMSQYGSPLSVYLDKKGKSSEQEDNEAMRQGRDLEEYVVKRFEDKMKLFTLKEDKILQHKDLDFMLGNIDRWVIKGESILECKTTGHYDENSVPAYIELQCHHYMTVTGATVCYLAVLVFQKDFFVKKIERDEEICNYLIQIETDFWKNYVEKDIMPAPDGSFSAAELIKEMYPQSNGETIKLNEEYNDKIARYMELKGIIKPLEKEHDQIEQEIKMGLKEAERGETGRYIINYKTSIKKAYSVKEGKQRRFSIKEVRE